MGVPVLLHLNNAYTNDGVSGPTFTNANGGSFDASIKLLGSHSWDASSGSPRVVAGSATTMAGDFTILLAYYKQGAAGTIFAFGDQDVDQSFNLQVFTSTIYFVCRTGGGAGTDVITATHGLTDNAWNWICVQRQGTTIRYADAPAAGNFTVQGSGTWSPQLSGAAALNDQLISASWANYPLAGHYDEFYVDDGAALYSTLNGSAAPTAELSAGGAPVATMPPIEPLPLLMRLRNPKLRVSRQRKPLLPTYNPAILTLSLTGVEGTGAVGTLIPAFDLAISGNEGAGAVGSLIAAIAAAMSGVEGTGAVGSMIANFDLALTGNAGTGEVGDLGVQTGADLTIALTGVEGTGEVGALIAAFSIALSGNEGTGQVGDLTAQITSGDLTLALSGVQGTGQVGTLTPTGVDPPPVSDLYVRHRDNEAILERYAALGDGTHAHVLTTTNGAGINLINRYNGLTERFVAQSGYHTRLVATATLGGADIVVRNEIDQGLTLRYVDMGGGIYAEKVATAGSTGQDVPVRIVKDNGVPQRYVYQGDGTWARLVATAGATGPIVRNDWDGYVFERWEPNGDGTFSQRVTLL